MPIQDGDIVKECLYCSPPLYQSLIIIHLWHIKTHVGTLMIITNIKKKPKYAHHTHLVPMERYLEYVIYVL